MVATNLQVNANTTSAVGAFNALANSIAAASSQFQRLGSQANTAASALANSSNRVAGWANSGISGFTRLTAAANSTYQLLLKIAGVAEFAFGSILKELDKLQGFQAIMSVTTKSAEDAEKSYDFLRKTANDLGVQFDTLTSNYAKLVAALPPGVEGMKLAEKTFLGVAKAARTLHSTNADTQLMFYAITQMASKGVVSMEELRRQLGEKLPGVMQIAARAINTTPELLEKAIRKGTVDSIKFLNFFADELNRTFGDSSAKAAVSVSASLNRLTNVWVDFVKNILDSGAGQSIVNLFDALREKLSDPYVIAAFSNAIKFLGDKLTEMISKLTADDIRNGFDTMAKGVEVGITVLQKFVSLLTWIINNAPQAGAVIGGVGGALAGARAGPWGALVGGLGGAGLGYNAGQGLQSSPQDEALRKQMDAAAKTEAANARYTAAMVRQQDALFKMNVLLPKLQEFKSLNSFRGLDNLFKSQNLNTKTIDELNKILASSEFKTDKSKVDALRRYAQTNSTIIPSLASVLTAGSGDKKTVRDTLQDTAMKAAGYSTSFMKEAINFRKMFDSKHLSEADYLAEMDELLAKQPVMIKYLQERQALEDSAMKAAGYSTSFMKEALNLRKMADSGHLSESSYLTEMDELLAKQPVMIKHAKEQQDRQDAISAAMSDNISMAIQQVEFKEDFAQRMGEELALAQMQTHEATIMNKLLQARDAYARVGLQISPEKVDELRKYYELTLAISRTSQYGWGAFWDEFDHRGRSSADHVYNMLQTIMDRTEDSWLKFVQTGKLSLTNVLEGVRDELAKKLFDDTIKPLVGTGLKALGGFFGMPNAGGLNAASAATAAEAAAIANTNLAAASTAADYALRNLALTAGGPVGSSSVGGFGSAAAAGGSSMFDWIGDTFISLFGLAEGGVVGRSGLHQFAKGDAFTNSVISKPTLFQFRRGGSFQAGVMGEAGDEAVMPLERGPGGKLGVTNYGQGGSTTNVYVIGGPSRPEVSRTRNSSGGENVFVRFKEAIKQEMADDVDNGVGIARNVGNRFSLNSGAGLVR